MNTEFEIIYESMIKEVFVEFCDLAMIYIDPEKVERIQELGRVKARAQKKRAKEGLRDLPKEKRETFVNGCYEELKVQLLKVLKRMLGESKDFEEADASLTEVVDNEKKVFKKWNKTQKEI